MPCVKTRFSKKLAQCRLNELLNAGNMDYGRIYECDLCGMWHLTSSAENFRDQDTPELKLINEDKFNQLLNR